MKTICVVTSTRADYGLLYWPIKALSAKGLAINLVVTGTHLSQKHGHTVDQIINDGFKINAEIDLEIDGDRPSDILRVMSKTVIKFSTYFENNRPDLLLLLGDRFEIFSVAQAALIFNIPIAHIHGGEVTEGSLDDAFRHCLTKMSNLHFTSSLEHQKRVIQLGEDPKLVFVSGAPGLDNIKNLKLLSRQELESSLGVKFNKKNILLTFHPITTSEIISNNETKNLFQALADLSSDVNIYLTMPNADSFSSYIEHEIKNLKASNPETVQIFSSLGQLRYLSLMKEVDAVVGNSSSGIIEAPFLKKAVVNVGIRQKGRTSSEHVIHVEAKKEAIANAIDLSLSTNFQKRVENFNSLYGQGDAGIKIANIISDQLELGPKKFYDLKLKEE